MIVKVIFRLTTAGLTCVEAAAAAAHSASAAWPSGSSDDELQILVKVWDFLLSHHCPLSLP